MNKTTMGAFVEEMVLIKEAGFQINQALPFLGKHLRGSGSNVVNAGKAMLHPVQGFKAGMTETVKGKGIMPAVNVGLTGLGAAAMVPGVVKKEDPSGHGRSRVARGLAAAGGTVGGIIGTPFGLTGGIAAGVAGEALGRGAGNLVDKARGIKHKKPPVQQAQAFDQAHPDAALSSQTTRPGP
jgi:hypothetical protein